MSSRRGRKGRKKEPYSEESRQEELTVTIRGPLLRYVRYLAVLLQPIEEAFPVDEETGEIDRVHALVNLLDPPKEALDFAVAYLIKEGIASPAEPYVEEDTFLMLGRVMKALAPGASMRFNHRRFSRLACIAALLAVSVTPCAGAAPPASPPSSSGALPWLKTSGNKIVTADTGQEVLLRGANILESEWRKNMDWERKAIPELARNWKGNVLVRGFASDPVNNNDPDYMKLLDEYLALTEQNHIYMVFSWRSTSINGDQPNMPDAGDQRALATLAARYRGHSNVIYCLQVEPHDVSWSTLRPVFESMVDAIRRASSPYVPLIMAPGTGWGHDISEAVADPVRRANIVYNSHPYAKASDFQKLFVDTYKAGLPVFIGEFGPAYCTMDDVKQVLTLTRNLNIGWAAWTFEYDGHPALITGDLQPTPDYGETIKKEMLSTPLVPGSPAGW